MAQKKKEPAERKRLIDRARLATDEGGVLPDGIIAAEQGFIDNQRVLADKNKVSRPQ
jgi:hypothetical protein